MSICMICLKVARGTRMMKTAGLAPRSPIATRSERGASSKAEASSEAEASTSRWSKAPIRVAIAERREAIRGGEARRAAGSGDDEGAAAAARRNRSPPETVRRVRPPAGPHHEHLPQFLSASNKNAATHATRVGTPPGCARHPTRSAGDTLVSARSPASESARGGARFACARNGMRATVAHPQLSGR